MIRTSLRVIDCIGKPLLKVEIENGIRLPTRNLKYESVALSSPVHVYSVSTEWDILNLDIFQPSTVMSARDESSEASVE